MGFWKTLHGFLFRSTTGTVTVEPAASPEQAASPAPATGNPLKDKLRYAVGQYLEDIDAVVYWAGSFETVDEALAVPPQDGDTVITRIYPDRLNKRREILYRWNEDAGTWREQTTPPSLS